MVRCLVMISFFFSFSLFGEPMLVLESHVEGLVSLYPGQKTKLSYTYRYSGDIELTKEQLPLLDPQGLIRIGEKEISDSSENGISLTTISQEVEAVSPGTYSFPPSVIEGNAYEKDSSGKRIKIEKKLVSEAPSIVLTVLPFPEKGKPASFNGALGEKMTFTTELEGSPSSQVGNELSLLIKITGDGKTRRNPLPDVALQPGFKGFFRLSDLPPSEKMEGKTQTAIVKLSPLNSTITEIPSIEFSFFNPATLTYSVVKSQPIPIVLAVLEESSPSISSVPPLKDVGAKAPVIKAHNFSLSIVDLYSLFLGSWWVLGIIPFGLGTLLYQWKIRSYFVEVRKLQEIETAEKILGRGLKRLPGSFVYFTELKNGLLLLGKEREDLRCQVTAILQKLDEKQFSKYKIIDYREINQDVGKLLKVKVGDVESNYL